MGCYYNLGDVMQGVAYHLEMSGGFIALAIR